MSPRRLRSASLACIAIACAAFASGCSSGREGGAGREGRPEDIGNLAYNVYISRILNLHDVEDSSYYQGPEAPPGFEYYGIFISVCNESRGGPTWPSVPVSSFKVVDTLGDTFTPLPLPPSNIFAYRPGLVKHRECIPPAGSIAAEGPTAGALLMFKLPVQAGENRPLDLVIQGPPNAATGRPQIKKIELDI